MDYTTLNEVTKTIITIIQQAVDPSNVVKVYPEILKTDKKGVGFYLYHIQENSHFKNLVAPGKDMPAVSITPMALNLFYQLSTNWKDESDDDIYEEQRLMSIAIKALHDNPVILTTADDQKQINIKVTLQTLTPSESIQYWAASESAVRLSAYYEVSVVFLEPEPTKSYAGKVLSYGNYVFVRGTPQITGSQNTLQYTVPGDPTIRSVNIQPAQAPPANGDPALVDSIITFIGTGFGAGPAEIRISNERWPEDALATTSWNVLATADKQVAMTLREKAALLNTGADVDIIPGLYAAKIAVTETQTLPDLTVKKFVHTSNQFPFSVMPRIDAIDPVIGPVGLQFTITGYLFQHADIAPTDIQLYVGEQSLTLNNTTPISPKEFSVTAPNSIILKTATDSPLGLTAVRLLIKGVESPPRWITIT